MALTRYRYELRRGDTIAATGHISYETALEIGQQLTIGTARGIVRELGPKLGEGELRLVIQLLPDDPHETA
jgi:hypothetical protein